MAEGQGAPESGTISAELARLMAEDGIAVEVLNLGVVAAALPQSVELARDATALLRPNDLIVVLNANDLPVPIFPDMLNGPATAFPRRDAAWWFPRAAELFGRVGRKEPIYRR